MEARGHHCSALPHVSNLIPELRGTVETQIIMRWLLVTGNVVGGSPYAILLSAGKVLNIVTSLTAVASSMGIWVGVGCGIASRRIGCKSSLYTHRPLKHSWHWREKLGLKQAKLQLESKKMWDLPYLVQLQVHVQCTCTGNKYTCTGIVVVIRTIHKYIAQQNKSNNCGIAFFQLILFKVNKKYPPKIFVCHYNTVQHATCILK